MAQSVPPEALEDAKPRRPPVQCERQDPRRPFVVEVWVEQDGRRVRAVTRNIGLGGLFLEITPQPSYGSEILVHLRLPPHDEALALPATVRWSDASGVGAQFGLLGARATSAIAAALASL